MTTRATVSIFNGRDGVSLTSEEATVLAAALHSTFTIQDLMEAEGRYTRMLAEVRNILLGRMRDGSEPPSKGRA